MDDKIAIVGYACRLPGQVCTPEDLWELCTRGRSGWSEIPTERFSSDAFYHPNPLKPGSFNPKGGYFLADDISKFDAPFFNLTEKEAISLDPQQRLLLECTFEALENAGIPKESLSGRRVGVYVGGNFADYELMNLRDVETAPMYQATGCAPAMQANRISHFFDFRGPSMTIDTACSGSLVALHQAAQTLTTGQATEAVVAGCRLNILPDYFVTMSTSQLLNDHGKTFAFDERADSGFAKGEGAGVVVLKPLKAALRDNDAIRAVITASGIGQDGRTLGITNPNGDAQRDLITRIYQDAGIDPRDCGFAEMHGTGTKVGDPIEAKAIHQALSHLRTPQDPLYIGSLKSNIGHLEGASGVVSVIKATMMLEKRLVLRNVNFRAPNPSIPLSDWNMKVLTKTRPWPTKKKYISVSNYGFGGTNAHAVLEMAPRKSERPTKSSHGVSEDVKNKLFVISANDEEALRARVNDLVIYFEQRPEVFEKDLSANVAYTLGCRRSHLTCRLALTAGSLDELGYKLTQHKIVGTRSLYQPKIGFVFTGQGAQHAQMGMQLMEQYPVFASSIKRSDEYLRSIGADFSLIQELRLPKKMSRINAPEISQPACTAIQIALVDLYRSWNMRPSAVVGHSSGEIAAAYAVGAFDADSAMALAYFRGTMTLKLKELHPQLEGGMVAVGLSVEDVRTFVEGVTGGYVTIACVNSPTSVTVSGDKAAISELHQALDAKGIFNRQLPIDVAYHSNHMALVSELYLKAISDYSPASTLSGDMFSSVRRQKLEASALEPSYWVENLVSPVQFADALHLMCTEPGRPDILIEVGPHSALKGPIRDTLKAHSLPSEQIIYSPSLLRDSDAVETLLSTAGAAFKRGVRIDLREVNFPHSKASACTLITDIPRYPWRHSTTYWHMSRIPHKYRSRPQQRNDVLGKLAAYSNDLEPTWRNVIRLDDIPWLRHHKMQGLIVFPFTGYLAMAIEAAKQWAVSQSIPFDAFELREVIASAALVLDDDIDTETLITLRPFSDASRGYSDTWREFRICSWDKRRGWNEHCRGRVRTMDSKQQKGHSSLTNDEMHVQWLAKKESEIVAQAANAVDHSALYTVLDGAGAGYGQPFQGLRNCFTNSEHCRGEIHVQNTGAMMPKEYEPELVIHPAFLDTFLHMTWPILGAAAESLDTLYMPTSVQSVVVQADMVKCPGEHLAAWCTGTPDLLAPKPTAFTMHATKPGESGQPKILFTGFVMTPIRDENMKAPSSKKLCYKLVSQPYKQDKQEEQDIRRDSPLDSPSSEGPSVLTNGVGNHDGESDFLVIQFGDDKHLSGEVVDVIDKLTHGHTQSCVLGEVDTTGKNVIIVQSEAKSLNDMNSTELASLKKVLLDSAQVLWGYPKDVPEAAMSIGLARTVRAENMSKLYTLGLPASECGTTSLSQSIEELLRLLWFSDTEAVTDMEFTVTRGELMVDRVIEDDALNEFLSNETGTTMLQVQDYAQNGRRLKMEIGCYGALDTIQFVDDNPTELDDTSIEIEVQATGVNFKDIVVCMGQVSQPYIGVECSGVVAAIGKKVSSVQVGQRVMAMTTGAYSTYARCLETSACPIDDSMPFEVAATIPVVYCTAYYALFDCARLQAGESVLIHAAAGGVGQAAIMLAKTIGAEIFATVGSEEKKRFIMEHYGIPEDKIFCSRNTSFGAAIRHATDNVGVDVVLNSLAGDIMRETWDCLAPFGRFIEIGKADITRNSRLDMLKFEYNCTFSSVDLTKVAAYKPKLMRRLLSDVKALMDAGSIAPISPMKVYPISELELALRALQSGKTLGKLVVVPRAGDKVMATVPRVGDKIFSPDATYVIIGGTGGLGRSIARWMSSKGARSIVLTSRNASSSTKAQDLASEMAADGTDIAVRSCDVAMIDSVRGLVEALKDLPPVRGVIHAAMFLKDTLFEQMTLGEFQAVTACKVDGVRNLHEVLQGHSLDFFVALSSIAGIVGNRGQAAYSAANVFVDSFMEWRRSQGLPGTSISLAAVSNVGYLADGPAARREEVLKNIGGQTIDESEVLGLLAAALTSKMQESCGGHCITGLGGATPDSFWLGDDRFSVLREQIQADDSSSHNESASISLIKSIRAAASEEEARSTLCDALRLKIAGVLVLPAETIRPTDTLKSLGLDSLVSIEIRNWIARETEASLQVLELLSSGSVTNLAELVLKKMQKK